MNAESDLNLKQMGRLIWEVRKTFRLMAGISDRMLEMRGMTASLRAIMEYLAVYGPTPVPKIAIAKSMKRQSVQALVDRLQTLGFVEGIPNPEHKRSVLIALTDRGAEEFEVILGEEKKLLLQIAPNWPEGVLRQTCDTLADFQNRLANIRRTNDVSDN